MVLTITDEEFLCMKMAVLDGDEKDALRILKEFGTAVMLWFPAHEQGRMSLLEHASTG